MNLDFQIDPFRNSKFHTVGLFMPVTGFGNLWMLIGFTNWNMRKHKQRFKK